MNIKNFYLENIKKDEYYYRFYNKISNTKKRYNVFTGEELVKEDFEFEIFDPEEGISKFKEMCEPNISLNELNSWFHLLSFYLYKNGYMIREFPKLLDRPPLDPTVFTSQQIREYLIDQGKSYNGTVRYADRRLFVSKLVFQKKSSYINIDESIDKKFIAISNRQSSFNNMPLNEKLMEIANLIEALLKIDNKFMSFDYSNTFLGYISEDLVKKYRKNLNCFRHSSGISIKERESYSDEQKKFLVDYGLTIVKVIHSQLY